MFVPVGEGTLNSFFKSPNTVYEKWSSSKSDLVYVVPISSRGIVRSSLFAVGDCGIPVLSAVVISEGIYSIAWDMIIVDLSSSEMSFNGSL